jgi:hypothetical protein
MSSVSTRTPRIAVASLAAIIILGIGLLIGHTTSSSSASSSTGPIRAINGIPVGVQDTSAGALAASDNYVTEATEAGQENFPLFQQFVRTAYVPSAQAATIASAQKQRAADPQLQNYGNGQKGIAFIGARRLNSFSPAAATTTSWMEVIAWGPSQQPKQAWVLVNASLVWRSGRWLASSIDTSSDPAPTPALSAPTTPSTQTYQAFDQALAHMAPPYYGSGGA